MGEAKRRRELARARREIGAEELARRQALNGKLRAAYGIPGDGGTGDECQMCGRPFASAELTFTGFKDDNPYDAGECCGRRLDTLIAVGIYLSGKTVPRARLDRAIRFIKTLGDDGYLKTEEPTTRH